MDKYILRYRGPMDQYKDDLGRIYSSEGTRVLDDSEPGLLLVESNDDAVQKLVESMPGWQAYPQHYYQLPEQRPYVKEQAVKQTITASPDISQPEETATEAPPPVELAKPPAKPRKRKKSNTAK